MKNPQPTLLILAAGMGNRFGGLKQIDPVGPSGETIIDYSIYDALRAGFGKIVFVIRRSFEAAFRAGVGARFERWLPVEYAFQEVDSLPAGCTPPAHRERPWGTGHAVLVARDCIREPFAVLNADDFYGAESFRILLDGLLALRGLRMPDPGLFGVRWLDTAFESGARPPQSKIAQHRNVRPSDAPCAHDLDREGPGPRQPEQFCMVGFPLRNTLSENGSVSRGICEVSASGRLSGIREVVGIEPTSRGARYRSAVGRFQSLSGGETVSMNLWGFTPGLFPHLEARFADFLRDHIQDPKKEFYLPTCVNDLILGAVAEVEVLQTPESWFGVTYAQDKPKVEARIRERIAAGLYPLNLWEENAETVSCEAEALEEALTGTDGSGDWR